VVILFILNSFKAQNVIGAILKWDQLGTPTVLLYPSLAQNAKLDELKKSKKNLNLNGEFDVLYKHM